MTVCANLHDQYISGVLCVMVHIIVAQVHCHDVISLVVPCHHSLAQAAVATTHQMTADLVPLQIGDCMS